MWSCTGQATAVLRHRSSCASTVAAGSRGPQPTSDTTCDGSPTGATWSSVSTIAWPASQSTWDKAPQDVACRADLDSPERAAVQVIPSASSLRNSAGNLAVNLAYSAALGRARSGCGGQVPIPEAVLVQYPIVAPQDAYDNGYPIRGFEPKMFTGRYLGGVPSEVPDRLAAISSITYLSRKGPADVDCRARQ